jgi:N-acetylneuraminic acid mutarotase
MINESKGSLPEARKGATMNIINNQLYVFGGFSRDTFNDLKVFDLTTNKWNDV